SRMPQFTLSRPRMKADEKPEDFKGRIFKEEAGAREAVATFVLGLTAEYVPIKSINQPKGDRLAEVKGRQILDKFNCAGCHLIRPGVYDFKPGEKSMEQLLSVHAFERDNIMKGGEIEFLNSITWVGRNPLDPLRIYGARPTYYEEGVADFTLSEALRFESKDKKILNIPAGQKVKNLPIADFGGDAARLKTQDDFNRRFGPHAPYGGTFADLLSPWLVQKDKKRFPDDADARGALPPSLIGQGERTQPDWLARFLLEPTPIRRLAILRMPKFNMSVDEANVLRAYFAAVTRQTNPGLGLSFPTPIIEGREDNGDFWKKKTAEYVKYLKDTKQYEARVKAYEPVWEQVRRETEPGIKAQLDELAAKVKEAKADM